MSASAPSGRGRRDPDPRIEFAVPQPKRVCAGVVRVVKVVDPTAAIERVLETRSSWRPINPDVTSPKHSLQHSLVKLSLASTTAMRDVLADEDESPNSSSPRSKSSDSTVSSASSFAESAKRRSPSSMLAVIHTPDISEDGDEADLIMAGRSPTA